MSPKDILLKYWGHPSFREPQEDVINSLLKGRDTVALLPTGGGKSICYQIPALISEGVAIIVSPLVSLMQDQVNNLVSRGIHAKLIKPGSSQSDILQLFENAKYDETKLLYLSPERLQSNLIKEKIKQLNISFVAVDEAHCISEWGHDFRPSFLKIKDIRPLVKGKPIIALTATANQRVLNDIEKQLELTNAAVFRTSFYRENLAYQVFEVENKQQRLLQIATKIKAPIIVYTNTRAKTKEIRNFLQKKGFSATYYHGGLTKEEKETSFQDWIKEDKRIMVATNAFGMGIDKQNVKVVVHMDIPYSIENYFQEAGRAGRNGKKAFSVLLWNKSDLSLFKDQFQKSLPNIEQIKIFTKKLYQHFQIALGEKTEDTFDFNFYQFCQRNDFSIEKSKHIVQILTNNGILEVSKDYFSKSTVQFLINPNQIEFQVKGKKKKKLIEVLLRSYSGLFTEPIKINEYKIAQKLERTSESVKKQLVSLDKKGILSYKENSGVQFLQFLTPREDQYMINRVSKDIQSYLSQKQKKIKRLLNFIQSDSVCRSRWLLAYFDEEQIKDCGICDVCLQKRTKPPNNLESKILDLLQQETLSSQAIFTRLKTREDWVLMALKNLLKKEKIKTNFKNQYCLHDQA